jgi:hypothetical protein
MKRKPAHKQPWTPFQQASFTAEQIESRQRLGQHNPDEVVFRNSRYQVNVTPFRHPVFGVVAELSIKTLDKAAHHDWRDFQRLKNELVGPEFDAIEIYPAESRLVDTANQYYLWAFRDWKVPLGFQSRLVSEGNSGYAQGSRQRPFEDPPPDLKTSDEVNAMIAAHTNRGQSTEET